MTGPLESVRIVDLCSVVSGPLAMATLADQGADVIKVEALGGDVTRQQRAESPGFSAGFVACNRGKRSIAIDLKQEAGKAVLWRLIEGADVFAQNFRPGAVDRLGFGYEAASARNEKLVYLSISGVGPTGPYAKKRVYDPIVQALAGVSDIQADPVTGRPKMMRTIVADKTTAIFAAQATTAALLAAGRTGKGQHVEVSMLDVMLSFIWPEGMTPFAIVDEGKTEAKAAAHDMIFQTRDGYVTFGAVSNAEWRGLCEAIGREEWIEDPRFATNAARSANRQERMECVESALGDISSEDLLLKLEAADVPCMPVLSRYEMLSDPQVINNQAVHVVHQPGLGDIRQARAAARFDVTPAHLPRPAPALGQHIVEVLGEAGFNDNEINDLLAEGIVATGPKGD